MARVAAIHPDQAAEVLREIIAGEIIPGVLHQVLPILQVHHTHLVLPAAAEAVAVVTQDPAVVVGIPAEEDSLARFSAIFVHSVS